MVCGPTDPLLMLAMLTIGTRIWPDYTLTRTYVIGCLHAKRRHCERWSCTTRALVQTHTMPVETSCTARGAWGENQLCRSMRRKKRVIDVSPDSQMRSKRMQSKQAPDQTKDRFPKKYWIWKIVSSKAALNVVQRSYQARMNVVQSSSPDVRRFYRI